MNDEKEYERAMLEASAYAMPKELRRLYAQILLFTDVKNPEALWDKFEDKLLDLKGRNIVERRASALAHVNSILKIHGYTLSSIGVFEDFDLSKARHFDDESAKEELSPDEATKEVKRMFSTMNEEQKVVFDRLRGAVYDRKKYGDRGDYRRLFFLQGAGGCGKTYLYRCFYYYLISKGMTVKTFSTQLR